MPYFVKIPKWIQHWKNQFIWRIPTTEKTIYLTFDDGPTSEVTDWILDQLNKYNAKATFFCLGKQIEMNSKLFERVKDEQTIANHSYAHVKSWKINKSTFQEDFNKAEKLIDSKLYRPPYGKIKSQYAKNLIQKGYKIIQWTVMPGDWEKSLSSEKIFHRIIKNTKAGDIIVMHDSIKASEHVKYCLPKILEHYTQKGYTFKPIPNDL